jgi:phosphoribosylglycinamide formyltransferase-1
MTETPPLLAGRVLPLRVAVLVSATGANLTTLFQLQADRPDILQVVLVASDRDDSPALDVARGHGVPAWPGRFEAECGSWKSCTDAPARDAYRDRARLFHDRLSDRLEQFEAENGRIDLVVLAYHRWIHGRLLERFRGRIINQHPGDLARLSPAGERSYIGLDPVGDALRAGDIATRTSTFLVDSTHDGGALLAQGPWVPYHGPRPPSDDDVRRHELQQKIDSDRPVLRAAVIALAEGRLAVDAVERHRDGSPVVRVDGGPAPLGGLKLDTPVPQEVR